MWSTQLLAECIIPLTVSFRHASAENWVDAPIIFHRVHHLLVQLRATQNSPFRA